MQAFCGFTAFFLAFIIPYFLRFVSIYRRFGIVQFTFSSFTTILLLTPSAVCLVSPRIADLTRFCQKLQNRIVIGKIRHNKAVCGGLGRRKIYDSCDVCMPRQDGRGSSIIWLEHGVCRAKCGRFNR